MPDHIKAEAQKAACAAACENLPLSEHSKAVSAIIAHFLDMSFIAQAGAIVASPMQMASAVYTALDKKTEKDNVLSIAKRIKPRMFGDITRFVYSSYGLELVPKSEKSEEGDDEGKAIAAGSS